MNSIYGLATKITIDGITLQATPIVNTTGSWLGTSGNTLNFIKTKTNNAIDWAFARTNQSNTGGQGTIATLSFSIPANVPTGTQIKLDFDDAVTRLIDLNGMVITGYNIVEATANSTEPTRINNRSNDLGAVIVPNPSSSEAFLLFTVNTKMSYGVHITDMAGRVVWQYEVTDANGQQRISLPVLMKSGFYIVKLVTEEKEMKVMQWAKQ
jgi:hypothetical protein